MSSKRDGSPTPHYVYLVPGFFGFSNLGGITYFHHVREALEEEFEARGQKVVAKGVATIPTGSIRRRAARLAEQIDATAPDEGPIHLIGHSTGGLDTRLLVTPQANLPTTVDVERIARRVRSVVTVSTPHLGTPIASVFNSLFGQNILWALSLATVYILRFGRLPLRALFALMGLVTRLDRKLGLENTILEQFYRELFSDFGRERGAEISDFLGQIRGDRRVVGQLTPGSIDLFNASTTNRQAVRYGCVVTRAAGVSLKSALGLKFDVYSHASHTVFRILQGLTARNGHFFDLRPEQHAALEDAYGNLPTCHSNDGVVPTLAQIWGDVVHVALADHLDVCGHFRSPDHDPPHVDWFISGSNFRRPEFEALWGDVAGFLLSEADDGSMGEDETEHSAAMSAS